MANIRQISGNTIGNNVVIVQGDLNTTNPSRLQPGGIAFGIHHLENKGIHTGNLINKDKSLVENIKDFLNQIAQTDPFYDKKRILELKGPFLHESFNWILDHKGFEKWRCTRESGVLWIKGDPGKGKTMLLCGIINELEEDPGISANLSYFFCQATDSRINTATSVIGALMIFFIKRVQKLLLHLLKEYEDKLDRCEDPLPIAAEYNNTIAERYINAATRPRELLSFIHEKYGDKLDQLNGPNGWNILCDLFTDVTLSPAVSDPVCIVDALDECEHNAKSLLSLIVKTSGHIKWLISSRNVKDIERGLRLIEPGRRLNLELTENAEKISKSVDFYINNSITDIDALEDDEELQIKTTRILKEKANGTFLWVALVIQQLRDTDHRNVEEVLEEMPEGLESLYDLIITRVNSKLRQKDQEACRILLSIITTAERPLHLEELHVFISSQWEHYKMAYNRRDMSDIVRDCGPLLSVRDDTIYFIHQSVKDYMVENTAKHIFPSGIEYQHLKMVKTSLSAMSRGLKHDIYDLRDPKSRMDSITPPNPNPLKHIEYCCIFWVQHLLRGGSKTGEFFIDDGILHTFLKVKYLCWLESLALLRRLLSHGSYALHVLKDLTVSYYGSKTNGNPQREREADSLRTFIDDAYHFFNLYKGYVSEWPLQLYLSAMLFEDNRSAISRTFQKTMHPEIGEPLNLIKPQKRFSLWRDIKLEGYVEKLLYSPNSSLLCVLINDGTVLLYNADTGVLKRVIKMAPDDNHVEEECPKHVTISWNSRRLVKHVINRDSDVNHVEECPIHVAFSSDSRSLVSVTRAGIVRTCTDTGALVKQFSLEEVYKDNDIFDVPYNQAYTERVISLSQNGDLAASVCHLLSTNTKLVRIWTTRTGTQICEIGLIHELDLSFLQITAFFSPNSALITLIYQNDVIIYSAQTGKRLKYIQEPFINAKASKFSPGSELLALVYHSHIHLWCTTTWTMICKITQAKVNWFDISPDTEVFVAVSQKALIFGMATTGEKLFKIPASIGSRPVFSPNWNNLRLLASICLGGVRIWRIDTTSKLAGIQHTSNAISVIISPESTYVATFMVFGGNITIWSGERGQPIQTLERGNVMWTCPVFSPNSELIAYEDGTRGDVAIWNINIGKSLHLFKGPGDDFTWPTMAFSGDSKHLLVGHMGGEVRVWCVESGECLYENKENHDDGRFRTDTPKLVMSRNSKYIAAAYRRQDWDAWRMCIWNWRADHCVSRFNINRYAKSLNFSSDDKILAAIYKTSSSWRGNRYEVQIWIVATGICLSRVRLGESYSLPLFDPVSDQILTDRFSFRRNSSWERWDSVPRRGYSLYSHQTDGLWLYVGGEKAIRVPEEFSLSDKNAIAVSASLLVFLTPAYGPIIIQLPNWHKCRDKNRGIGCL